MKTQSSRMWGFSLGDWLPYEVGAGGITAVSGEFDRIGRFISDHFSLFAEEAHGSSPNALVSGRKLRYLRDDCDLIELRCGDDTVGVLIGAPEDWSTYYVRVFALRRDFQRFAVVRRFLRECILQPLSERGVERICADTSPANHAASRLFGELNGIANGSYLSDRWGPLNRYTLFLSADCDAEFRRKFGLVAPAAGLRTSAGE